MTPGSIKRNINVNPRTGVIFAIFAALMLTALFGIRGAPPATANQLSVEDENFAAVAGPNVDMQIDGLPGGPTGDPSIDLSHGAVHTSFSLGGTLDNTSPSYNLTANYSSNVKNLVKVWTRDHQPSELGLGWTIDHPRIIRMNLGTGREDDDKFVYYAPGQAFQELIPDYDSDSDNFRTYDFKNAYQPTTRIERYMGSDDSYWVVTMPTGLKYYYGGKWGIEDSDNYSDDFKQVCVHLQHEVPAAGRCQSGPIEYGVQWGDWVGASQNPKNQENIEVTWNLSRIESITGKDTTLYYVNNIQDVGRQVGDHKPKAFSRSAYLYRVQQESGAKTVLAYCPLTINSDPVGPSLEDEAQPARYTHINTDLGHDYYSSMCGKEKLSFAEVSDPHTESAEPDGYQERIKQVLIGGSLHFVAGSGAPVSGTKLSYDFLQGKGTGSDMVKRVLVSVQPITYKTHSSTAVQVTPPTEFSYWGQDQDDGVTTTQTDFSKIFNKDTGGYYGAMKSMTSSTGGTKTYTYRTVDIGVSRHLEIPSKISYARTAFFSDKYIVLVGSNTSKKFVLEIVEWTARGWDVTYRYEGDNYPHGEYDAVDLLAMQPTLLAFANRDRNKVYVLDKRGTTAWKESKFEAPTTYDGRDHKHVIRNITVHDRTVFMASSPTPSDGIELSDYTVSAYDVDTHERIIHYEAPDLCSQSKDTWAIAGLAVGINRMALLVGDRPDCDDYDDMDYMRVRAYVTFYDPVEDKWSDFVQDDKKARWCLANTNSDHTDVDLTCAEPDEDYSVIRGQFVDDTLLTIVSGLKVFPSMKDARHDEVPIKFFLDPDKKHIETVDSVDYRQVSDADQTGDRYDYPWAPVSGDGWDCDPEHDYHAYCLPTFPFVNVTEGGDTVWKCCTVGNPIDGLNSDIITAGKVAPTTLEGYIEKERKLISTTQGEGLASMLGDWHIHKHNAFGIHPDSPLKYSGTVGAMTKGGVEFYSSYLEAEHFLSYVKLYWKKGKAGNDRYNPTYDARDYDLLTASCDLYSFDGEKVSGERLYFNPKRDTGALAEYVDDDATSDHLSRNIYVNVPGETAPDLSCAGAISLTGNSLISYNQDGARTVYSLYPRIDKDGNSVMYRSLGNIKGLGPNISLDDMEKYDSINAAQEEMQDALKDLKAMSKAMEVINYVMMAASLLMDLLTFNFAGLVQNAAISGFMIEVSEFMKYETNHVVMHDQSVMQQLAHKMGTTHLESNFSGSRYTLHNTALLYRDTDGTIKSTADLADDIRKDDHPVTALYIKKYDTGSGIVTFQSDHGPYLRMLLNGTEGPAESISAGDNMTAGEDYDLYPMGQGRVFLTYEKDKGPHDHYTCLTAGKDRVLTNNASEDDYDSPCLFGARGKVFVHRVMEQTAMGNLQPVVIDTVTIDDGLQTTKVSYDFEASTAAHHGDSANFNKATVYPGGRDGNNGRIEQLMYNGAESDVEVWCEIFKVADEGPSGKCGSHDLVDSKIYRDQMLGRTYEHSIFEHGETDPQVVTTTEHKVQVVERKDFPDTFRVFTIRTDNTRDNVTTVTKYQYNKYGQKAQTDVVLNNHDWDTGTVYDEISSASHVYAWETDAYGKAFRDANRYTDVVQTTTRLHHDREHGQVGNFYKIIGPGGRCMEATGDSNEANVQLSDCDEGPDQLWNYDARGLRIKSFNGKCLEAEGAENDTYEGNVQLYKCVSYFENIHDGIPDFFAHLDGQQWEKQFNDTILTSSHDPDNNRCLDTEGGSSSAGTNIEVSKCGDPNGQGTQTWRLVPLEVHYIIGPGGKCIETVDNPGVDGSNVQLNVCDGGLNQQWQYEDTSGEITNLDGKCMEAYPYNDEGTVANVQLFKCVTSNDDDIPDAEEHVLGQFWARDEEQDSSAIVTFSTTYQWSCINVDGDAIAGANIQVDKCIGEDGSESQQWRWVPSSSSDGQPPSITSYSRIVGSKATKYEEVSIDGLSDKVYLPKRSYTYQTGSTDETGTPDFDPSNPGSKWLAVSETIARDKSTGISIATKNSQTDMVSSRLLTHSDPHIMYASFSNANAHDDEVGYIGFEAYESHEATNNFKTSGGSTSDSNGYAGLSAYGSESEKVSVTVGTYGSSGRPSLLSAWVRPSKGHTCEVAMDGKKVTSAKGDGSTWLYLEVASNSGSNASVSCGSGGYIDEALIRPIDSSFGSSTHDAQYRTLSKTNNNGVVTHLVRDQRNRVMGSYQRSPAGEAHLLGLPIAGWSRYGGYGFQLSKEVPGSFTQNEPNHVATVALRDDDKSWFVKSWSENNKPTGLTVTPRFVVRALVDTDNGNVNMRVGSGSTQLSLTSGYNESTSETHLTLSQNGSSKESGEIPSNALDRVLTWVVIDQFSVVFLDGKMVLHTRELNSLSDSNPVSLAGASYNNVFIGQDPTLSRSFHDGAGRTIQSQSIRLDDDNKPVKVAMSQTLYDGWGKPSVQTKLVERDQAMGGYDSRFVTGFNWGLSTISGDIVGATQGHPFTQTRYASSPMLRPSVQSLLPGDDFDIGSSRTEKFAYGSTHAAGDNGLLGDNDLYETQNFIPYTDDVRVESTAVTDKAGRTVSTSHGNKDHGGYQEWTYQYDYIAGTAFQEITAYTPNYNAATVDGHDQFKNTSTTWDNAGLVKSSQEPDLSGYAMVIKDDLGRPRFTRKSVSYVLGDISGASYIKYGRKGRIAEIGVLKNVTKNAAEFRALANDPSYPSSDDACVQTTHLYDADVQTGYSQPYLTGRLYGLVSTMNLIPDNPTDSCHSGEDLGHSYIFYQYDQRGRTIGVSEVTDKTVRNSAYTYDNLGNRLALVYPEKERMTSDDQATGFAGLSADRKRALLFDSADQTTVYYPLNSLGQLDAICDKADCSGTQYASEYRYDVYGKIVGNKLDGDKMVQSREYDFQERLTRLETKDKNDETIFAEALYYDPYQSGNIRRAEYIGSGLGDGVHRYDYGYDIWGRLVSAVRSNGDNFANRTHKYEYTYDHNGNMLTKKITGATDDDVIKDSAFAYVSGKNQLASVTDHATGKARNFTHNDYGAVTQFTNADDKVVTYELHPRNDRVHKVSIDDGYAAEYLYDPLGRRIFKNDGSELSPDPTETYTAPQSGKKYTIVGPDGQCLRADGSMNGDNVNLAQCQGDDDHQKWEHDHDTKVLKGLNGMCLVTASSDLLTMLSCSVQSGHWDYNTKTGGISSDSWCIDSEDHDGGVKIANCDGGGSQTWIWELALDPPESGVRHRIIGRDDRCLDVHGGGHDNGDNVQIYECNGGDNQNWTYDSGSQEIMGTAGKCLDIQGGSDGTNVQVYECHGEDNQKWIYNAQGTIESVANAKCLDVSDVSPHDGSNVELYGCDNADIDRWDWESMPYDPPISGATSLITRSDGKCLDVSGANTNGDARNIHLWECHDGDNQLWTYHHDTQEIQNGDQCIDVQGDPDNGANIHLNDCSDGEDRHWTYDTSTGQIKGISDRCLDVQGGNSDDGTNVQLYDCHSGANQRWLFVVQESPKATLKQHDAGVGGLTISHHTPISVPSIGAEHGSDYNDQISAIEVADGYTVEAYEHADYEGAGATYVGPQTIGAEELTAIELNDAISSYKLYETPVAPDTPTNLVAEPGDAQVTLTWDDPGDDSVTGYEYTQVESGAVLPAPPDGITIPDSAPGGDNATSYVVTGLVNGTEYVFRIRAISEAGTSSDSDAVTVTPAAAPAPAAPANLNATVGDGQVTLSWDDPNDDSITGYEYRVKGEIVKLLASDGAEDDEFGYSIDVVGDTLVIGSHGDDDDQGSAYVFARAFGTWTQIAKLTASDGDDADHFGLSVALSGNTIIVGSPWSEAAYVFVEPSDGWTNATEIAKLTASDGAAGDYFGQSVSIDGDTVMVGSYNDDDNGADSGSAYVFVKPDTGWANATETAKLTSSDGAANDYFGHAVAVSGDTAVVGAYEHDSSKGATYVFVKPSDGWSGATETAKLTASDGFILGYLGYSVAIDGDTVMAGAHTDQGTRGAVYAFVEPSDGWANATETAKITASDESSGNMLGYSVALDGDTMVAGAHGHGDNGASYVFKKSDTGWADAIEVVRLTASDGADGDQFGWSVALDAGTVKVGARSDDTATGSAYAFDVSDWIGIPDSASGEANHLSYAVDGLVNGAEYAFQIRAINEVGVGPDSDGIIAIPVAPEPELFAAPAGLIAMPDDTRVVLRWDEGDAAITQYQARAINGDNGGITTEVIEAGGAELFAEFLSLTNGTEYTFEVNAESSEDGLPISEVASTTATPAVTLPSAPDDLAVVSSDQTTITITWTSDDITVTRFQYNLDGGDYADIVGSDRDTGEYTVTGLDSGTGYVIGIRAQNFSGEGANSTITSSTTSYGFSAPTGLIAMPDDERVALQWNVDDDDITNYQLMVSYDDGEVSLPLDAVHPKSFLSIESVENGTEYTFSIVVMTDGYVDSEPSTVIATPNVTLPETPSDLSATVGTDQVALEWTSNYITVTGFQ